MARSNIRARSAQAGALLAAAILGATAAAAADGVRVTDAGGGRLVIEAHDATVGQILDALGRSHAIRFQPSEALSRHVTGTYSGTLPRVLSRILDGYDHVIRSTSAALRLDIVGTSQSSKSPAPVANSVKVSATRALRAPPRTSSNVDLDEENARNSAAGPQIVNLAAAPKPPAPPPIHPSRAGLMSNALQPGVPHISSNVTP